MTGAYAYTPADPAAVGRGHLPRRHRRVCLAPPRMCRGGSCLWRCRRSLPYPGGDRVRGGGCRAWCGAGLAWYRFQFVLIIAGATPVTCFVLDYAYPGRWLTRRNLFLFSIPPLFCLLMAVINDSQLIWRRLEVGADGSVVLTYAPGGALLVAYGLALFLLYTASSSGCSSARRSTAGRWRDAARTDYSRAVFLLDNAHPPALPVSI